MHVTLAITQDGIGVVRTNVGPELLRSMGKELVDVSSRIDHPAQWPSTDRWRLIRSGHRPSGSHQPVTKAQQLLPKRPRFFAASYLPRVKQTAPAPPVPRAGRRFRKLIS